MIDRIFVLPLFLFAFIPIVNASIISPLNASAIVQSTATDTDFLFLTGLFGQQGGQVVNYSSSSTTSDWSGMLSGAYQGTNFSVAYSGDLSAYPSGPLTWTSTGTYGSLSWSGSGSLMLADTSTTMFQSIIADSLTIGGATATLSGVIAGMVLPDGTVMYGSPANPEAGPASAVISGTDWDVYYSYRSRIDSILGIVSDIGLVRPGDSPRPPLYIDNKYITGPHFVQNVSFDITGTVSIIPEPATWLLVSAGFVGLFANNRRRQRPYSF